MTQAQDDHPAAKRAVGYLRVSTVRQAKRDLGPDGLSIPAQQDICERKARELGVTITDWYIDRGESARTANRTELQRMLARLHTDPVDYVIIPKVDRFARNRVDDALMALEIKKTGAKLISATENIDETPSGQLLHGIMASIAEFYSRNLATEVLKGTVQKARNGGTPTMVPLGYLNVRQTIDGRDVATVIVDEERAPLIVYAFEAYATGTYTLVTLLEELTDKGLTMRPTASKPARPLTRSRLHTILTNPYYTGIVTYRGVQYPGRHTPLVSAELFEQVQAVLRSHANGEKQRVHQHYLKSSLYCARCGSRLCVMQAKRRYLYFFCLGRQYGNGCRLPYLPADEVEEAVASYYRRVQLAPKIMETFRAEVRAQLDRLQARGEREAKRQRARIAKLEGQRTKLLQAHYADAIPLELLKSEQDRISRELVAAERMLAETRLAFADIEETFEQVIALITDCERLYRLMPPVVRRQMNQAFFERILVDEGDIPGAMLAEPFATVMAWELAHRQNGRPSTSNGSPQPPNYYHQTQNSVLPSSGPSSNETTLVGMPGFEPGASTSRTWRAAKLRYIP